MLRRVTIGALALASVGTLAGCSSGSSGASEPLSTVGLGTDIDFGGDPARIRDAVPGNAAGAERIDRVVMIGDSITRGSTPALEAQFASLGLDFVIESATGKRMVVPLTNNPDGASIVEFLSAGEGQESSREVWVVALGTNDIGQYAGPDEIAAAVNEVLDGVPEESALIWVDTYIRDRVDQADVVNRIIRERVGRRGNAIVAPWTSFAAGDGVVSGDGVHPTPTGAEVFAAVVANTVSGFIR